MISIENLQETMERERCVLSATVSLLQYKSATPVDVVFPWLRLWVMLLVEVFGYTQSQY